MYIIMFLIFSCYKSNFNLKNNTYKTNFPYELTDALEKKDEDKVIGILKEYDVTGVLYNIRGTAEELNTTVHMYVLQNWKGHAAFFDRVIKETLPINREYLLKEGYYGGNILHYIICRANSSALNIFFDKLKENSINPFNLIDKAVNLKTFKFMVPFKDLEDELILTPLMLAIQVNDIEMIKTLLKNKANPNEIQKTKGINSLIFATIYGKKEIVQLLLDNRADFTQLSLDRTHEDATIKNLSAIMWAVKLNQREIIDLLIAYDKKGIIRKHYKKDFIKKRVIQSLTIIGKLVGSMLLKQLNLNANISLENSFDSTSVEKFIRNALDDISKYKEDGSWLKYYPYFDEKEDIDYYLKHFSKLSKKMDDIKAKYKEEEKTILSEDNKKSFHLDKNAILSRKCRNLKEKLSATIDYHSKVKNNIESLIRESENQHRSSLNEEDIKKIKRECEEIILQFKERKAEFECFITNPNSVEKDVEEEYNCISLRDVIFNSTGLVSNRKNSTYSNIKNLKNTFLHNSDNRNLTEIKIVNLDLLNYKDLLKELKINYLNCFIPIKEEIEYAIDKGILSKDKKYWIKKTNNLFNYYFNEKVVSCLGIEKDIFGVLIEE